MKTTATQTGASGEMLACDYLRQKGYTILHQNWRAGKAEVDIIARIGNDLVFVEVKTRSSALTIPEKAVNRKKQLLLFGAAQTYGVLFPGTYEMRFDIVAIIRKGEQVADIMHFEHAFFPFDGDFRFNYR